ncbi:translation initiation factor IF-2 [bacterium]|nr:translation initiation factor IF-2 [bacterium]
MRVHELAKELNTTSKELIDKVKAELDKDLKSHSSEVAPAMVDRIKKLYANADVKKSKPKAFIVKKAKAPEVKVEETPLEEVKPEPPKSMSRVVVKKVEKPAPAPAPVKPEKVEAEKPKSRLEIVREAPKVAPKPRVQEEAPQQEFAKATQLPYQARVQKRTLTEPKQQKPEAPKPAPTQEEVQPVKRHIISQDMYNKNGRGKRGPKDRRTKEEEQERISLEKATQGKHKKHTQAEAAAKVVTEVVINKPISVNELSDKIAKSPAEIIKFLMLEGMMLTVNTTLDIETARKIAEHFEIKVLEEDIEEFMALEEEKEEINKHLINADKKSLVRRAPVVTIMGHVDHGKTTLLDSIRASKHKITSGEVGGITQSIGAYTVKLNDRKIVFIDTPGHEAFTQMRARGTQSTDIAILVVAADDGIMPQTIESINHARSAGVPIIVAVNKIDKEAANPDRVLQQLTEHGLIPEEWGGETIVVKVSALQKTGIDELLEYIILAADMAELKAVKDCPATGVIIEANLDKGKGPVATMLVQNGTLKIGDSIVVGSVGGKVRALLNDAGERVKKAGPSTPVEILGLSEVPQAGDFFEVVENEKEMKRIIAERKDNERVSKLAAITSSNLSQDVIMNDEIKTLNLIIKANTHGSAEAVSQAIQDVKSSVIVPKIIHAGVGDISEADIMLASASDAIILGFTVKEDQNALNANERANVPIRKYDIIYQVLEDVEKTMISLLSPEIKQVELGKAEVRQIFTIGKVAKIAGCYVTEGKIVRSKTAVVIRDGVEIFKGEINQLKRFKEDVKEVAQGFECGISFAKFNDLQEGDIIEVSTTKEIERSTLV